MFVRATCTFTRNKMLTRAVLMVLCSIQHIRASKNRVPIRDGMPANAAISVATLHWLQFKATLICLHNKCTCLHLQTAFSNSKVFQCSQALLWSIHRIDTVDLRCENCLLPLFLAYFLFSKSRGFTTHFLRLLASCLYYNFYFSLRSAFGRTRVFAKCQPIKIAFASLWC